MGLFDLFGGKKHEAPHAPPPAPLGPWQQALRHAEATPGFAWADDNEPARAFARWLLTQASPAFGNGKVVDGTPPEVAGTASVHIISFGGGKMDRKDRNVELHGVQDGVPVCIPISLPGKRIWTIAVRFENTGRYFTILRDHARIPAAVDAGDPWAKDRPQCVFLGKGIFLDDSLAFLRQDYIDHWATVPVAAQELVVSEMERLDLRVVQLSNIDNALFALGNKTLEELDDPIAFMRSVTALLVQLAKLYAAAGTARVFSGVAAQPPVTCSYCASIFLLTASRNTCPNCGAPAR